MPRLYLLLATAAWAFSFSFVKFLRSEFYCDPTATNLQQSSAFVFIRFFISTILLGAFYFLSLFFQKKEASFRDKHFFNRDDFSMGALLGVFGGLGILFQTDGMAYTNPGTSAFLTQLTCILVPLIALLIKKRKLTGLLITALLLGLGGIVLISGFDPTLFYLGRGEAETLLCACFFTIQILVLESSRFKRANALRSTLVMFFFFALVNLPFIRLQHLCVAPMESSFALPILLMTVVIFVCTLIPFYLMTLWQPRISSTDATFIYSLEAVFAFALTMLIRPVLNMLGYPLTADLLTPFFISGALLLIVANLLLYKEALHRPLA